MKMTARARLTPWTNISRTMSDWEAFDMSDRPCTCHPDDNPPRPCPQKYALTECREAADKESLADEIERLRAERDAWEGTAQWHYKEAFALRARLAEALDVLQGCSDTASMYFGPGLRAEVDAVLARATDSASCEHSICDPRGEPGNLEIYCRDCGVVMRAASTVAAGEKP